MSYISLLIKPASGSCNMSCEYCFYCDEAQKRKQASYGTMSEATLKNVIRKGVLVATSGCTIGFQGGEPTLCGIEFFKKAVEFSKQYNKRKIPIQFTLQTNGYKITPEFCEFLKENNFLIGLSVDGTKATHNRYRHNHKGEDTYDRMLATAQLFDQYQVEYNILTVVHKETASKIQDIYQDYKKRGWKYLQFIACLDPLGEVPGKMEYSLTPQMYGAFLCQLFDLWYKDYKKGKQPYIRQFENYIGILAGYLPESCEQRGICGIQHVVEADGSVYPCDFFVLDQYRIGNFNENSMVQIQENCEKIEFIKSSINHSQECETCKWFTLCRGGCKRNRNDAGENYFCEGYKKFFQECFDRMEEIKKDITR